ncbi:MAG TPA: nucleotidyltransferase domain-containing protein [Thermoprotei archaeon]|nr:MAG: hypothetical protein DRJ63_06570 [Thermoprotei archaeon]HDI74383.1 nucleotidyltransferase domain-containing protein [Thermoprotei archaeon]
MKEIKYYKATAEKKRFLIRRIEEILSKEEKILVAIIYGSFTRRNFFRDIDIAVYTGGLIEDSLRFENELCLKLTEATRVQVDVRVLDEAPAWFRLKVAREGIVIYEKFPGAYSLFLKEAVGDYQDLKLKYKYINLKY